MATEAPVYFFIGGSLVGRGSKHIYNPYSVPWVVLPSWALLCPKCGEVWARIVVNLPPEFADLGTWMAQRVYCRAHGGGVLTDSNYIRPEEYHPDSAVLRHDFLRLMEIRDQRGE